MHAVSQSLQLGLLLSRESIGVSPFHRVPESTAAHIHMHGRHRKEVLPVSTVANVVKKPNVQECVDDMTPLWCLGDSQHREEMCMTQDRDDQRITAALDRALVWEAALSQSERDDVSLELDELVYDAKGEGAADSNNAAEWEEALSVTEEDLSAMTVDERDDEVHTLMEVDASEINNGGSATQLAYLVPIFGGDLEELFSRITLPKGVQPPDFGPSGGGVVPSSQDMSPRG